MLETAGLAAQALGAAFVTSSLGASELILGLLVGVGFLVSNTRRGSNGESAPARTERPLVVRPHR